MGHDGDDSRATSDGCEAAAARSTTPSPPLDGEDDDTNRNPVVGDGHLESRTESVATSERALSSSAMEEEHRPQLPPRPTNLDLLHESRYSLGSSVRVSKKPPRPRIVSTATTALSRTDIHIQSFQDGSRETFAASAQITPPTKSIGGFGSLKRFKGYSGSDAGDTGSVRSYAPTLEAGGDVESLLGEVLESSQQSPAWQLLSARSEGSDPFESIKYMNDEVNAEFYREFDELRSIDAAGANEGKELHCLGLSWELADPNG